LSNGGATAAGLSNALFLLPIAAELLAAMILGVKVEVRAAGPKAMREKRGLMQRKLALDLGISQNYVPAIEANSRQAGPRLQHRC